MKCPKMIYDKRMKKERICNAEVRGMTGLQEAQNFQKHLRTRHNESQSLINVVHIRAESGQ